MFKYPHTDFNKINLDWIMRKIKALEPSISLVQSASDMLSESETMLSQAQAALDNAQESIDNALETVESVQITANTAVNTANHALEVAEQSATATIADGAVTWPKLAQPVQTRIVNVENNAISAQENASAANSLAQTANTRASDAMTLAASAESKANRALSSITKYYKLGDSTGNVIIPECDSIIITAYNSLATPRSYNSVTIPYLALDGLSSCSVVIPAGTTYYESYTLSFTYNSAAGGYAIAFPAGIIVFDVYIKK